MSKAPNFPFYVRDWMCSRKVLKMSGSGVKAYIYLLCEAWLQIPRATLPNDDKELASMARLSIEAWIDVKVQVLECFKIGECKEHLGRFFNELQLEISRKYENNQRFNNKNAKRTRIKREVNATLDNDNEDENERENEVGITKEPIKQQVLELRESVFVESLKPFIQYPEDMRTEFVRYWSEPNKSKTKMRFELQPTWDLSRRLVTWASRAKINTTKKYGRQEPTNEVLLKNAETFIKNLEDIKND
jgi:uncharacterized protein YdaU (DUF1376 family)